MWVRRMKNGKYCIAITCIGSGVGQSIIDSCNLSELPLVTVGLGSNHFGYGAYDCTYMDYLPSIYSSEYVDKLIEKCLDYKVDLIIPGLDDEALILAEKIQKLSEAGLKIVVSSSELLRVIRDKARLDEVFSSDADIFFKSYSLSNIAEAVSSEKVRFPLIAKPRSGFASRGIEIILDKKDLNKINDTHIVQELAVPSKEDPQRDFYLKQIQNHINPQISEISIQLVMDKNGNIMGKMASYNKLHNGVPIEITPFDNSQVWSEIDKLIPAFKRLNHRGPLNIQGRLTDYGFRIFEMNARFTGITGLRAIMGFNEVESCIKDWLDISTADNSLQLNNDRFGVRQTRDKAISLENNLRVKALSNQLNKRTLKAAKTVMVTGAGGYLGQNLVTKLAQEGYEVFAFNRSKKLIKNIFSSYENVKCFDSHDLDTGVIRLGLLDYLIHCAFARPHYANEQIADGLKFTSRLIAKATMNQVPAIVNISSQSVYGTKQEPLWTEDTPVIPESVYAQGKYASELIVENAHLLNKQTYVTSLRLASLAGGSAGFAPVDLLTKLVERAMNQETITVIGGQQRMERLDIRDAVAAITALLKTDYHEWEPVYNLGSDNTYSVIEISERVICLANEHYGKNSRVEIKSSSETLPSFGMDSGRFRKLTGWAPKYDLDSTIESLLTIYIG